MRRDAVEGRRTNTHASAGERAASRGKFSRLLLAPDAARSPAQHVKTGHHRLADDGDIAHRTE
jgi:hypothetical protein